MPNSSKPQVLVVDDDPCVRESLGMLLISVGYDVVMADNGVSAVSHLEARVPDVIVTDLNMPQMSGIELISHVRSRYPSIPVVAMSGDFQDGSAPAGIIADRFYPKSQHPYHLLTTIASLIATDSARRTPDESRSRPMQDS